MNQTKTQLSPRKIRIIKAILEMPDSSLCLVAIEDEIDRRDFYKQVHGMNNGFALATDTHWEFDPTR